MVNKLSELGENWKQGLPQDDDISILAIKRTG